MNFNQNNNQNQNNQNQQNQNNRQNQQNNQQQNQNREEPDRTPLCLQFAMETGAQRNGRYHAFRSTINATDRVLVAEEDHRRGPMSCYLNRPVIVSTVAGP